MAKKTVCVTGASGYIASWLVKFLLQRGYTVNATVRDPNDKKKTDHLTSLDGAKERLHLFKANLLEEGSFDAVFEGCEGVFHTASPCYLEVKDPQAEMIDPALKGTLNVLESVAKTPSVRRVVLTSSVAAVVFNGKPRTPEVVVDETWWSDPDFCRESQLWYMLSKTLAEDAAWKFMKEKTFDMVTINPAMVIGSLLQPTLNTSAAAILQLLNGSETYPNYTFGWVNVKDVALAHILAFENPSANDDPKKTDHLTSLDGAKERIHLFKASLLEEGSFDAVVDGCEGVFHTASPCYLEVKDPQLWYLLSKTLAEDAAWKFVKEKTFDMVTINPTMVIGSLLQPTLNTTCAVILQLLNGSETYPIATSGWVNVKDVALAHILAFENPSANGRYIMVESVAHYSELVQILRELYPTMKLPKKCVDDKPFPPKYQFNVEKAKILGVEFTPLAKSIKETAEKMSLIAKTVCVTGASGYIASWLVKFLLHRGYTVKASVRDPNDPKKTQHLLSLGGAKERLHLFKANLLEEGSFDAVVDGCEGVFHTASPFYYSVTDPQAELLDPAVKGTLNLLGSCAKAPSVKRVVLTSSIAAVAYSGQPRTPEVVVDESWWTSPDYCKAKQLWYVLSKTLAEDAAWKFVKEKGIDMVVVNPAMVIGPLLQPTLNTSSAAVLSLVNGAETYPNSSFGWVNVKDVANAHILAFENPSANGRYLMVERVAHYSDILKILRDLYPTMQLPEKCADDNPLMQNYQVSREKAKSLGVEFTTLEESIKETVESLKEKKFFGGSSAIIEKSNDISVNKFWSDEVSVESKIFGLNIKLIVDLKQFGLFFIKQKYVVKIS
ncbi:hypothetical protein H5410_000582, partial [Solanum commersonii]